MLGNTLGIALSPIDHLDSLPKAGRLKLCLVNWRMITSDPWIWQVVTGYPHRFDGQATTGQTPQTNSICRRSTEDGFRRDPEAGSKISNQASTTEGRPVYQSDLLGPQERRIPAPCSQPEAIEPLVSEVQIQDGGCKSSSGPNKEGRLDDINRFKGRLPISPNFPGASKIPSVHLGGNDIRVSVSPLWPQQCPQGIYKVDETSDGAPETARNSECDIPGRYLIDGRVETGVGTMDTGDLRLLGFRINWEKSQLVPTQVITYLGFIIDVTRMKLTLPEEKVQQIITDCQSATNKGRVTVRELSKLIGRMSATMLAVLPAPLCYRGLQQLKNRAFATSQSYETTVTLTKEAIVELRWWTRMLRDWNGRPILPPTPDLIIETDASLLGWGAASAQGSTGGFWSEEERACHINALELMGGALATKTFAKGRQNIHIHLRMDNRTAMTYINRMGGNKVSNSITGGMR